MEFQHSVGFRQNPPELMEEGKVLRYMCHDPLPIFNPFLMPFLRLFNTLSGEGKNIPANILAFRIIIMLLMSRS